MKIVTTKHVTIQNQDKVKNIREETAVRNHSNTCEGCEESIFCELAFYNDHRCDTAKSER